MSLESLIFIVMDQISPQLNYFLTKENGKYPSAGLLSFPGIIPFSGGGQVSLLQKQTIQTEMARYLAA